MRSIMLAVSALASLAVAGCAHETGVQLVKTPSREAALSAGAGGSHAPGSTGLGSGTQGVFGDPVRVPRRP